MDAVRELKRKARRWSDGYEARRRILFALAFAALPPVVIGYISLLAWAGTHHHYWLAGILAAVPVLSVFAAFGVFMADITALFRD